MYVWNSPIFNVPVSYLFILSVLLLASLDTTVRLGPRSISLGPHLAESDCQAVGSEYHLCSNLFIYSSSPTAHLSLTLQHVHCNQVCQLFNSTWVQWTLRCLVDESWRKYISQLKSWLFHFIRERLLDKSFYSQDPLCTLPPLMPIITLPPNTKAENPGF